MFFDRFFKKKHNTEEKLKSDKGGNLNEIDIQSEIKDNENIKEIENNIDLLQEDIKEELINKNEIAQNDIKEENINISENEIKEDIQIQPQEENILTLEIPSGIIENNSYENDDEDFKEDEKEKYFQEIIDRELLKENNEDNSKENPEENINNISIIQEKNELEEQEPKKKKKGFFSRLVEGLAKTRNNIISGIDAIFSHFSSINEEFYEELEEILIMADLGVNATNAVIEDLKEKVKINKIKDPKECKEFLIQSIKAQMSLGETAYEYENRKSVVMLIGVNGVGKTTSVGKLAAQLKSQGKKVMMVAADTFRAAAIEQLTEWSKRSNVDIIAQHEGSDPAAVVFDAVAAAKARNVDVLICDTAGRLHNKKNLMEELRKINRVIDKEYPNAYRETLVVLDGTTGQNALVQAKQFNEVVNITGIILTKLDGTAKGGIAVAIQSELGIPVKYIGIGEKIEDLQKFNADDFVNALFTNDSNE